MSQIPRDEREEHFANLLRQALEDPARPLSEPEPALSEALGAALFLRHNQRPPSLGAESLAALAREIEAEAQHQLAREEEAAHALALALAHPAAELAHEEAASALGTALFLRHAKETPTLGASFLAELGQSLQQAVQPEPQATARERRIAESLRAQIADQVPVLASRANSPENPLTEPLGAPSAETSAPSVLRLHEARAKPSRGEPSPASDGPALSEEEAQTASKALRTALFLRHVQETPSLGREALAALAREVESEAKARARRRQRFALLSGASALALAASLLLLLRPPAPRAALPDANFPSPPRLTQEFKPGSDPLTRLDPLYEAGLRGMREARFVGAHYANAEK